MSLDLEGAIPGVEGADRPAPELFAGVLGMWAEVMRVSVEDARRFLRGGGRLTGVEMTDGRRALRWLWSDSQARQSFCWTCSLFWLDPDAVREALAKQAGTSVAAIRQAVFGHGPAG